MYLTQGPQSQSAFQRDSQWEDPYPDAGVFVVSLATFAALKSVREQGIVLNGYGYRRLQWDEVGTRKSNSHKIAKFYIVKTSIVAHDLLKGLN